MRKASALLGVMFVMATTFIVLALPAGAQTGSGYPPASTTPTTKAASAAAANLAFTGSDSQPLLIFGIVAVTLGAVIVVATRRRSSVRATKA